jgi:zinc transporter, ZIP family
MMGCFVIGFIGIQIVTRILHRFMPSHVVDCDHTHDEEAVDHPWSGPGSRRSSRARGLSRRASSVPPVKIATITEANGEANETSPLLGPTDAPNGRPHPVARGSAMSDVVGEPTTQTNGLGRDFPGPKLNPLSRRPTTLSLRRPSMVEVRNRMMSFVKDTKPNCDHNGPCYGYSDPCGQECFKHLGNRSSFAPRQPRFMRTTTSLHQHNAPHPPFAPHPTNVFANVPEGAETGPESSCCVSPTRRTSFAASHEDIPADHDLGDHEEMHRGDESSYCESMMSADKEAHHHHVPTNAFMSIGLQTVIAIALHKFPEGFITYATNHASPQLGFSVFMALFVHNIAEGFAMALPLYMALGSRLRAVAWSSALGGLSQPLGAGVAVLWFKVLARRGDFAMDNVAYACLFAITAGIMTSVALQLFVESLSLNHNRNISILFAFLGMSLMGFSNAIAD